MSVKPRFSRILAGLALMAGVVTFGQLPGASVPSASAAVVLAAPWQYGTVIAGGEHLCFVGDTSLNCAGDNTNGQLGDGTTTDTTHGKKVVDANNNMLLANANKAIVGLNHTCMLTSSTRIMYCWGDNQYGQLGDGTTTDRLVPTIVANNVASGFTNSGIDLIVGGHNHTCAVKSGQMYCWGRNDQGQLGNGSTTDSSLAVKPAAPFDAADAMNAVSAGDGHTCATYADGNRELYCWGDNQYGQLGNGSNTDSTSPVMVSGTVARGAQQEGSLAASANSTCVASGSVIGMPVVCWGRNNNGQLGNGTTTDSNIPVEAVSVGPGQGGTYRVLAAGGDTVCMREFIGTVSVVRSLQCWGANNTGQIAGSSNIKEKSPVAIAANPAESFDPTANQNSDHLTVSKSAATGFVCYEKWCWGSNSSGQLATGDTTNATLAVKFKIGTEQQSGGSGGNGGNGGSGGGGSYTPAPALSSITVVEEPSLKVKITVTGLAAGATLRVMAYESDFDPVSGSTEYPSPVAPAAGISTITLSSVRWATSGMSPTFRSTPFVVGTTYNFDVYQTVGSSSSLIVPKILKLVGVAAVATAETTPTTTPTSTTISTTVTPSVAVVPGVTVTDAKVYTSSTPAKVAEGSAIAVMTPEQAKVNDIVSLTPQVCLAADNDLVFINTGKCIAQMVNEKTGKVLRTLKTTIVGDDVSELNVGNEIVTLAPIYFDGGSSTVDAAAKKRIAGIKSKVTSAGTVLLVGHSGILMGNTPENLAMGRARAIAARNALISIGAKGPFYFTSAGALDPATKTMTEKAQAKNRRVVIVLIP